MKKRGFALTELLIAVAVLMVIFGLLARQAAESRRRAVVSQIVAEYVTDFQLITRASRELVDAQKASWSAGSLHAVTFADLRGGGFLPSSFAARSTGDGTTPMGNPYLVVSVKDASGPGATTVVSENGDALAARLESAGLATDATGLAQLKQRIAASLVEQRVIAGTIAGGTTVVNGAGSNGWSKALAAYFATAPSQTAVATLIGFPDLESEGGGGSTPTAPMDQYKQCRASMGNRFGTSGSCPAGWTEINRWQSCQSSGFVVPLAEIGSALTFGTQHISLGVVVTDAEHDRCVDICGTSLSCQNSCGSRRDSLNASGTGDAYIDNAQISVNNVIIATSFCQDRDCRPSSSTPGNYICTGNSVPAGTTDAFCCEPN